MDKEKNISLLDRYIRNECNADEISDIETRLQTDIDFANDYQVLKDLEGGTRLDNLSVKMQFLDDIEKKMEAETLSSDTDKVITASTKAPKTKVRQLSFMRYASAAIALILLAVVSYNWLGADKAYDFPEFDQYVLHETSRSVDTPQLTPDQQRAFNNYTIQDFKDAIPLLRNLWEKNEDTMAGYYLGISYWVTGQKAKAKEILELEVYKDYKKPY